MPLLFNVLEDIPLIHPDLTISTKNNLEEIPGVKVEAATLTSTSNLILIVATKLFQRPTLLNQVLSGLSHNGFALSRESCDFEIQDLEKIEILTVHDTPNEKLILFKKSEQKPDRKYIEVTSKNFDWMAELKEVLTTDSSVTLYSQNQDNEGILGFVNCIRKEPGGSKVGCVFVMDEEPKFDPENSLFSQQIQKNMAFNVYKDGQWGTYRHLLLEQCVPVLKDHSFVSLLSRGDLSSLRWMEGPLSRKDNRIVYVSKKKFLIILRFIQFLNLREL